MESEWSTCKQNSTPSCNLVAGNLSQAHTIPYHFWLSGWSLTLSSGDFLHSDKSHTSQNSLKLHQFEVSSADQM